MALECIICGQKADRCHIKTKGSGGTWDESNLLALCRHHHIIQHKIGFHRFCKKFPEVNDALREKGWEFKEVFGVMRLQRTVNRSE